MPGTARAARVQLALAPALVKVAREAPVPRAVTAGEAERVRLAPAPAPVGAVGAVAAVDRAARQEQAALAAAVPMDRAPAEWAALTRPMRRPIRPIRAAVDARVTRALVDARVTRAPVVARGSAARAAERVVEANYSVASR
jgi:hypothetical protein